MTILVNALAAFLPVLGHNLREISELAPAVSKRKLEEGSSTLLTSRGNVNPRFAGSNAEMSWKINPATTTSGASTSRHHSPIVSMPSRITVALDWATLN
jgi:hypothetical protein